MSTRTNINNTIDGSMHLHGAIADSMEVLRDHVDSGEYIALRKLLESQLKLADQAGLMVDDIMTGTVSDDSAERIVLDELVRQIERALSSTNAIAKYIATEKDHVAQKLRTLQEGTRAVQSYARLSGR